MMKVLFVGVFYVYDFERKQKKLIQHQKARVVQLVEAKILAPLIRVQISLKTNKSTKSVVIVS
jgi:hypothetical protein